MTDNRTTELLPCPFCGGEAKIIGSDDWLQPICRNHACPCDWTDWYTTKAEAIAAWNTRAIHGTLTAEQVEKATYAHSIHADCADADWQAIADELNAELGSGTCENSAKEWGEKNYYFVCSECGWNLVNVGRVSIELAAEMIKTCPNCGRKVVGE